MCSQASAEGGSPGEEAVQQHTSPAVDVLGDNPQAAKNVAGVSLQHAPQPDAAAPCPVPLFTNPSTVPILESNNSAFLSMETTPQNTLPDTPPISSDAKDGLLEEAPTVDSVVQGGGVAGSLPAFLTEDCSPPAETQRLPGAFLPPLPTDTQINSTVQELQYGSQTDKEKSLSSTQTNKSKGEVVVITGAEEIQTDTLEYKPETGTHEELAGKEHTDGYISLQPQSHFCSTASSASVSQSIVEFQAQDSTENRTVDQSKRDALVCTNQGSHIHQCDAAEQAGSHQNSMSPHLPVPISDSSESEQTDLSKSQPKINLSNDTNEIQRTICSESVEIFEHFKEHVDPSHKETQFPSVEILETPKAGETPGVYTCPGKESSVSSSTTDREDGSTQSLCHPAEGEQVERSGREEQTVLSTCSSNFIVLPECSSLQGSSSEPSSGPHLDLVDSVQTEQFVEAETSHSPDQVPTVETPLITELVHSADAQRIVVVKETCISGDWSDIHLNQSYLLQQEDGSLCEAAVVNQLSSELSIGEPKLYGQSIQSDIELESQPVEVYEICGLVEEVAEETVCASSSAQIPHSPGYEVNLFNALLDHSDDYAGKEDLDSNLEPSLHTRNESDNVIISQQTLLLSHDANQIQVCTSNSLDMSVQNTVVATVGQHIVLGSSQAGEVANSSEVCLVEVTAITPDSFTVEQADINAQIKTPCLHADASVSDQTEVSISPIIQTVPQMEATASTSSLTEVDTGENIGMDSSIALSVHDLHGESQQSPKQPQGVTVVSATKPMANNSSHEGTKETPTLTDSQSQNIHNVAVTTQVKPEASSSAHFGVKNPKLLLLKQKETPLLKPPPTHLAQVAKQQTVAGKLVTAHSSQSATVSEECLPETVSAADSICESVVLSSQRDQMLSVNKTSEQTPLIQIQHPAMAGNIPLLICQYDKEALTVSKTASREIESVSQNAVTPTDVTPSTRPHTVDMRLSPVEREGNVTTSTSSNQPVSQPGAVCMEEESEEMEHDGPSGEMETHEVTLGQESSPEEGSDEEPEADKTDCGMDTPSSEQKVFSLRMGNRM